MDEEVKKKLARVYYGEGTFMSGLNRFLNGVNKSNIDVSPQEAKNFYENQTITQVFKPRPTKLDRSIRRQSIINYEPFKKIYADTMFFTSKNEPKKFALVCYVDGFSKYGYVYYIPLTAVKDQKTSVSVNDGVKSLKEYLGLLEHKFNIKPTSITTDDGSEFSSAFVSELKNRGIDHMYGIAGDVLKNPKVENFNYSIRLMIEKFRSTYQPKEINEKLVNKIVEKYNELPSSSLGGLSPEQALEQPEDIRGLYRKRKVKQTKVLINRFPDGTWVRVSLKKITDPFAKTLRQNWSTKVYQVNKFDRRRQRYVVDGKFHIPEELQKVDKDTLDNYDMFHKIIKNASMFEKEVNRYKPTEVELSEYDRILNEIASMSPTDFTKKAIEAGYISNKDPTKTSLTTGTRLDRTKKIMARLYPNLKP